MLLRESVVIREVVDENERVDQGIKGSNHSEMLTGGKRKKSVWW